jgi:acyl dehydratase
MTFRKPVLVGDSLVVKGVVKDKIESARILRIETIIESNGEVVISGEAQVKLNT